MLDQQLNNFGVAHHRGRCECVVTVLVLCKRLGTCMQKSCEDIHVASLGCVDEHGVSIRHHKVGVNATGKEMRHGSLVLGRNRLRERGEAVTIHVERVHAVRDEGIHHLAVGHLGGDGEGGFSCCRLVVGAGPELQQGNHSLHVARPASRLQCGDPKSVLPIRLRTVFQQKLQVWRPPLRGCVDERSYPTWDGFMVRVSPALQQSNDRLLLTLPQSKQQRRHPLAIFLV
mmetsp:Transcript_19646/g.27211  ORF Transcript_19646/g.27211 Transcript_19646/m.27211 type:complete len:229 (-) Transcript_19646:298-984(-)